MSSVNGNERKPLAMSASTPSAAEIGWLKGFAVDPADHGVSTYPRFREGHLWGRREVAIPVSAGASLDDGIRLNITENQVEELPPRA